MKSKIKTISIIVFVIAVAGCAVALFCGNKQCETPEYQVESSESLSDETPVIDIADENENEEDAEQEMNVTNHVSDTNANEDVITDNSGDSNRNNNSSDNSDEQKTDLEDEDEQEIELPFVPAE